MAITFGAISPLPLIHRITFDLNGAQAPVMDQISASISSMAGQTRHGTYLSITFL